MIEEQDKFIVFMIRAKRLVKRQVLFGVKKQGDTWERLLSSFSLFVFRNKLSLRGRYFKGNITLHSWF